MNVPSEFPKPAVELPPESVLLRDAYKKSGLAVADIGAATSLSPATITIALSGVRYRDGIGKVAAPSDRTVVKLASVLRIAPKALREVGRPRAAELLEEALETANELSFASELDAQAIATGRELVVRQVLAVFGSEELRAELDRRDRLEREREREREREQEQEDLRDLAETFDTDRWPIR